MMKGLGGSRDRFYHTNVSLRGIEREPERATDFTLGRNRRSKRLGNIWAVLWRLICATMVCFPFFVCDHHVWFLQVSTGNSDHEWDLVMILPFTRLGWRPPTPVGSFPGQP